MRKAISILAFAFVLELAAQDQSLFNPALSLLHTNPSFAGSNGSVRGQFVFHDQLPQREGRLKISNNSFDSYVAPIHGGLAVSAVFVSNPSATYWSSHLNLICAPTFVCWHSEVKITPAMLVSYVKYTGPENYLLTGAGWRPDPLLDPVTRQFYSVGGSILINYRNFYIGGAAAPVSKEMMSNYGARFIRDRFSINVSNNYRVGSTVLLNIAAVYSKNVNYSDLVLATNALLYRHAVIGLGTSFLQGVFFNAGYRGKVCQLVLGYSSQIKPSLGNLNRKWQLALALKLRQIPPPQLPVNFENW